MEELTSIMRSHRDLAELHYKEFAEYRNEARKAMVQINTLASITEQIVKTSEATARAFDQLGKSIDKVIERLLGPATGASRIPLSVFMVVVAILGTIIIFKEVKESTRSITLSPTKGLSITETAPKNERFEQ